MAKPDPLRVEDDQVRPGPKVRLDAWDPGEPAYQTCRLVGTAGEEAGHPEVAAVLALHDTRCGVPRDGKLA